MLNLFKNKPGRIIVLTILVIIIIMVSVIAYFSRGLSTYKNMTINNIDLSTIPDGIYRGIFDGGRWSNTVEVTVNNHSITAVRMVESAGNTGIDEIIIDRVITKQSPDVDAVTGATVSSKAIMKAIENALTSSG